MSKWPQLKLIALCPLRFFLYFNLLVDVIFYFIDIFLNYLQFLKVQFITHLLFFLANGHWKQKCSQAHFKAAFWIYLRVMAFCKYFRARNSHFRLLENFAELVNMFTDVSKKFKFTVWTTRLWKIVHFKQNLFIPWDFPFKLQNEEYYLFVIFIVKMLYL